MLRISTCCTAATFSLIGTLKKCSSHTRFQSNGSTPPIASLHSCKKWRAGRLLSTTAGIWNNSEKTWKAVLKFKISWTISNLKVNRCKSNLKANTTRNTKKMKSLRNNTTFLSVIFHLILDYVELNPYYELGFRRRLMIRNLTMTEQKIGYNLNMENNSGKSFKPDNSKV